MKFITDDIARAYALKVAEMRGRQIAFWDSDEGSKWESINEIVALELEVDRLTLALLDDRANLDDEPEEGGGG